MKYCHLCGHRMQVADTRELSENLDNSHAFGCVKYGLAAGEKRGIVRERRCPNCNETVYTREVVIHIKERNPTRFKL